MRMGLSLVRRDFIARARVGGQARLKYNVYAQKPFMARPKRHRRFRKTLFRQKKRPGLATGPQLFGRFCFYCGLRS
jgi:hypothetical protein